MVSDRLSVTAWLWIWSWSWSWTSAWSAWSLSWWSSSKSSKSSYYDDDLIIRLLHLNGATASLVWQPNLPHPATEQCTPKYFVHTCQKYLECNQKYLYNTFRKRFKFTRKYFYHTFQKHSNAIRNIFMTIFKNIWNALRNICSQIFEIFSFGLPQARWPIVFVHAPHKTFKQGVNFQQSATFYKNNAKWRKIPTAHILLWKIATQHWHHGKCLKRNFKNQKKLLSQLSG